MLVSTLPIHRIGEQFTHALRADMLQRHLLSIASLISVCFSVFVLLHAQPINTDGILYLQSAAAFTNSGIKAAMQVYPWPLYAILIGSISQLTSLSVLHSAYVLNAVFDMCTVILFIQLTRELTPQRSIPLLAAMVILSFPFLNHMRDAIVRGHGYYPLALLSLLFIVRYVKTQRWRDAIALGIAMLLATLFRVEGVALLCLAPLAVFFGVQGALKRRIGATFKAYSVHMVVGLFGLAFLLFGTHHDPEALGRSVMIIDQLQHGLLQVHNTLILRANHLRDYVLPIDGRDQAMTVMIGGMFSIFLFKTSSTLGLFNVLFAGTGLSRSKIRFSQQAKSPFIAFILIITLTCLICVGQKQFLSGRYVALLCLLLLLYVPFGLHYIISQCAEHPQQRRWQAVGLFTLLAFLYMILQGLLYFGPSKTYIVKTGEWIDHHAPRHSTLYTNNAQLGFYAQRKGTEYPVDFSGTENSLASFYHKRWRNYDYLAFKFHPHDRREEQKLLAYLKLKPMLSFHNDRGDKTLVFKVPSPTPVIARSTLPLPSLRGARFPSRHCEERSDEAMTGGGDKCPAVTGVDHPLIAIKPSKIFVERFNEPIIALMPLHAIEIKHRQSVIIHNKIRRLQIPMRYPNRLTLPKKGSHLLEERIG